MKRSVGFWLAVFLVGVAAMFLFRLSYDYVTQPDVLRAIPFMQRAKVAMEWAVKYYALLCVSFGLFMLGVTLLGVVAGWVRKLKPEA